MKQNASINKIKEIGNNIVIYADGSVMGGTRHGGAAMVVTEGNPEHPTVINSEHKRGALYTCSNEEEVEAMKLAMTWVRCTQMKTSLYVMVASPYV